LNNSNRTATLRDNFSEAVFLDIWIFGSRFRAL
jgi:hypothetical protein